MYGTPSQRMPETEAMLTIAPLPCRSICGSTCLQVRNMLFRLTSLTRSQLSSVVSTGPPTSTMPTLLCNTSIRPNALKQASTIAATSSASDTLPATASQVPPSLSMIRLVSAAASRLMSAANTFAPSRAKSTAVALPLPQPGPLEPAPETKATLSLSRSPMCSSLWHQQKASLARSTISGDGSCYSPNEPKLDNARRSVRPRMSTSRAGVDVRGNTLGYLDVAVSLDFMSGSFWK